ncbi:MAG: IS701 family transposase [Chloroflexota bacterium]
MCYRLWLMFLLIIWVLSPLLSPDELGLSAWCVPDYLAERVVCQIQAQRRMHWLPRRAYTRRRHSRCRGSARQQTERAEAQPASTSPDGQSTVDPPAGNLPNKRLPVNHPQRWGLTPELSQELPEQLHDFWQRFYGCFKTQTRNDGGYAYHYLSALLRMETKRNYTNIGQATGVPGENVQHFMSKSPWVTQTVLKQVREEIKATPGLQRGGMLLLDESADETAGDKKAGAGRQYNGRLGKVDLSQIGVFLAYVNLTDIRRPVWTWVDGELFLQEHWFSPEMAEMRQRVGLSPDIKFETKIELGLKMILRMKTQGLPFEAVGCDDLYGRSTQFRDRLSKEDIIYMADVPRNTQVYLEKPVLGVPQPKPGHKRRRPTRLKVLNGVKPFKAHQLIRHPDTVWKHVRGRPIERGELNDPFTARRVWSLREGDAKPVEEWLLIRRESPNRHSYSLSNAPASFPLKDLAWLKCQRYFVERSNQDAKSEAGWDELQAQKYRGWEHHLALVILAIWFVAQVKWSWGQKCTRDPALAQHFEVEVLPALSMANIRTFLRAAMPLHQPTPEEAVALVASRLVNRTRSRKSRLKRQKASYQALAPP